MNLYAVMPGIPEFKTVTLSYTEGISVALEMIAIAAILSLIVAVIARIMKVKGKDSIVIFFTSLMVKSVYFLIYYLLDMIFNFVRGRMLYNPVEYIIILICYITITSIIEGLLLNIMLKNNKRNFLKISLLSNGIPVVAILLKRLIFDESIYFIFG